MNSGHPLVQRVDKRVMVARLGKLAAALEDSLRSRANDTILTGHENGSDVMWSPALGIEVMSDLDFVRLTERSGLQIQWNVDGTQSVNGRTHSRGYDRITNMVAEAMWTLA
jgi:hypothetical protein